MTRPTAQAAIRNDCCDLNATYFASRPGRFQFKKCKVQVIKRAAGG